MARVLRLGTDTRAKSVVEVLEMLAQLVDSVERKSPAHKFCVSSIRVHTANICHKSAGKLLSYIRVNSCNSWQNDRRRDKSIHTLWGSSHSLCAPTYSIPGLKITPIARISLPDTLLLGRRLTQKNTDFLGFSAQIDTNPVESASICGESASSAFRCRVVNARIYELTTGVFR